MPSSLTGRMGRGFWNNEPVKVGDARRAQLVALSRSTCDLSGGQFQAFGAATLICQVDRIGCVAALAADVPAIHVSDHKAKLKA